MGRSLTDRVVLEMRRLHEAYPVRPSHLVLRNDFLGRLNAGSCVPGPEHCFVYTYDTKRAKRLTAGRLATYYKGHWYDDLKTSDERQGVVAIAAHAKTQTELPLADQDEERLDVIHGPAPHEAEEEVAYLFDDVEQEAQSIPFGLRPWVDRPPLHSVILVYAE